MLTKSALFVIFLTLSSFALAQEWTQEQAKAEHQSVKPDFFTACYSSGSGHNTTEFCVVLDGNIVQFTRDGQEMINVGLVQEGYGFCDLFPSTPVAYFDYNARNSGNLLSPSVFSQNGNTITVTRATSDGLWQLQQAITNIPASASGPASAKVSMSLTNLSGVTRAVNLLRYADVDADSRTTNDFDYTNDTAFGLAAGPEGGLGSTNNTFSVKHFAFAQNTFDGPDPCNPRAEVATQPFVGDGSIVQLWILSVPHGATKTVVSTYKPI